MTIVSLVAWNQLRPQRLHVVPAPLVAVVIASVLTAVLGIEIHRIRLPENLIASSIHLPTMEQVQLFLSSPAMLGSALVLALVASAEALLCASAVDRMHDGPRTQYDRELVAQASGTSSAARSAPCPRPR